MSAKRTVTISLRPVDEDRLEELTQHHPLLRRHRVAEMSLHLGLTKMYRDRSLLDRAIEEAAKARRAQ